MERWDGSRYALSKIPLFWSDGTKVGRHDYPASTHDSPSMPCLMGHENQTPHRGEIDKHPGLERHQSDVTKPKWKKVGSIHTIKRKPIRREASN